MAKDYVEQHDEGYWITGTRVSLDSVVYAFLEGLSPESIVDSFDTLTIEEVYGAIAFYLGHRDVIDAYLKQSEAQFDELCRRARERGTVRPAAPNTARTGRARSAPGRRPSVRRYHTKSATLMTYMVVHAPA